MDNVIGRKVRIKYLCELPEYLHTYVKNFAGEVGIITKVIITNEKEETVYQIDLGDGTIIQAEEKFFIFIDEEENENMAALTGYKAVAVIEKACYNQDYHFAIYEDGTDYKPGDMVKVSGGNGFDTIKEIITPEEAHERFKKDITAEVICKIDTTAYDERVRKRKEAADIKKEMDKMIKVMDENKKYEMYANENPELLKLLNKFKEVSGM